jgi:iron-regulated transporter 1
MGIGFQLVGVLGGTLAIFGLNSFNQIEPYWGASPLIGYSGILIGMGLMSSLGATLMDISIANDLVPSVIEASELPQFNSRMRQIDLLTEVVSPIVAGVLLILTSPGIALFGFLLVALWNLVSFFPEFFLLRSVFRLKPELLKRTVSASLSARTTLLEKLVGGWRAFFKQPVAPAVLCYALLWLSVLSPHGVLLTGFLKDGWNLPEVAIGIFRGAGALFGLAATFLFPIVIRSLGLLKGSQAFVVFQVLMVALAVVCFWTGGSVGQAGFLVFILFSRIGLYGFSLGETQIRQVGIASEVRGEVNGFANALTGIATLALYGFGALLPSTSDFSLLVIGSAAFICLAAVLFSLWSARTEGEAQWKH